MPYIKCEVCGAIHRYPGWRGFRLAEWGCRKCGGRLRRISKPPKGAQIVDLGEEIELLLEIARDI